MRVAIDYTSALMQTGGVGRYTRSLVNALIELQGEDELRLWSARIAASSRADLIKMNALPPVTSLPLSERWLTAGWQRLRLPIAIDRFIGPFEVLHCPDFVAVPSRRPVIITIHDLSYLKVPQFAHPKLAAYLTSAVPRAIDRAGAVVAVSEATANDVAEMYPAALNKVVAIPNGVDAVFHRPDQSDIQATLGYLRLRQPFLVIVGTIEPRKNHLGVLRAFELAHASHRDMSLVIAGHPGWLSDPIMSAIRAASARLPIVHLENLADEALTAVVAGSLALIYPSWYEGFGLPVAEAMACGTAVITSPGGALEEVAGDAALLVDPADVEAMAEAMVKLHDDLPLRQRLIERGLERVGALTWERSAEAHWRLYRKVVVG